MVLIDLSNPKLSSLSPSSRTKTSRVLIAEANVAVFACVLPISKSSMRPGVPMMMLPPSS